MSFISTAASNISEVLEVDTTNNKLLHKLRSRLENADMMSSNYEIISEQRRLERNGSDDNIYMVKSLVWSITNTESSTSSSSSSVEYITCVLHEKDYIDESLLLQQLNNNSNSNNNDITIEQVTLAEASIAEYETGYPIGTIPPIGHDSPMTIYIDEGILSSHPYSSFEERLCVGCGIPDYHLIIPLKHVIQYAQLSSLNIYIRPIVVVKLQSNAIIPTTNIPKSKRNVKNTNKKLLVLDAQNMIQVNKLFYVAAGKKGGLDHVIQICDWVGDGFPKLMEMDTETNPKTKNALHNAAWTGDISTMTYLMKKGHAYNLNLIDTVSVGKGNYGKTPIFYAITRGRDEVVSFLLSPLNTANVLVVNNKGQTPSSMAGSHLLPSTCDQLFALEYKQLVQGNAFENYRKSHSDGVWYGDLDPRFVYKNDINYMDDIAAIMLLFWNEQENNNDLLLLNPSLRAVRVTTHESRSNYFDKKKRFRNEQKECGTTNNGDETITTTSAASYTTSTTITLDVSSTSNGKIATKTDTTDTMNSDTIIHYDTKTISTITTTTLNLSLNNIRRGEEQSNNNDTNTIVKLDTSKHSDDEILEQLPILILSDIFKPPQQQQQQSKNDNAFVNVIDTYQSLEYFHEAVDNFIKEYSPSSVSPITNDMDDLFYVTRCWGVDCEWKPCRVKGEFTPVSTLQLSNTQEAFIVDLQTLCQSSITISDTTSTTLTVTEKLLSQTLFLLFSNPNICLVGFGISVDLQKLITSFPHLPCFQYFASVIDLPAIARHAFPQTHTSGMSSLRKTVRILLHKDLNKSQQCSNWDKRPLTPEQIKYASLDAAVAPKLLACMLLQQHETDGRLLNKHPHLRLSLRFTFLPPIVMTEEEQVKQQPSNHNGETTPTPPMYKWFIPNGKLIQGRNNLQQFSKQSWATTTVSTKEPAIPEAVTNVNSNKQSQKKPRNKQKSSLNNKQKKMTSNTSIILLKSIPGDIQNLPTVGTLIGDGSKESCIRSIIGYKTLQQLLPNNIQFKYKTRSGVIELDNCVLLFINFSLHNGKYKNLFLNGGKKITFSIDPTKGEERFLIHYTEDNESTIEKKKLFLFIRPMDKYPFLFCGECLCVSSEIIDYETNKVILILRLLEFNSDIAMMLNDILV